VSDRKQAPGWVVSNEASVWSETEQSRRQTPAQRWADVVDACGQLALYWQIPGYPERIKQAVDPVPDSTVRALRRLRDAHRKSQR
jgi:hypothetical protein